MTTKKRLQQLAGILKEGHEDHWPSKEDKEEEIAIVKNELEKIKVPETTIIDDEKVVSGRREPEWMRPDWKPEPDILDDPYKISTSIDEQIDMVADGNAPIVSVEPNLASLDDEPSHDFDEEAKNILAGYVSFLRAIHLWFHAAHHLTKGTGFSGDHSELYERIYTEVQDEIDGAIEKAVGITNDENLACPIMITRNAIEIMEEAGCEVNSSAIEIAEAGLKLEKTYINFVEEAFETLENMGALTLGLNDQLAASANAHETFVFLLQQRVK